MASLAVWFNGYSLYRPRQHGSSLEQVDVTTSLQCWGSFIGCLWDRESTSNWRFWFISLHGLTLSYLSDDCQLVTEVGRRHLSLPTSTRVPCRGHSHRLATWVSRHLVYGYGTTCRSRSDGETLPLYIISGYLSQSYYRRQSTRHKATHCSSVVGHVVSATNLEWPIPIFTN